MDKENPIFQSLSLIESRIREKLTVERIAGMAYFSKYHYQRLFREMVGDSVMGYVIRRKLTLAGEALIESDTPVIDIAMAHGYDSREGFTRSFKAYMGVSPTEFRKCHRATNAQKPMREREAMCVSKTTDEIVCQFNRAIALAKALAQDARSVESKKYEVFWSSVAEDTDALAARLEVVLGRVSAVAEDPDEITRGFAILKAMEDIAAESDLMALYVGLSAVGRAQEQDARAHKPLYDRYVELARLSSVKTDKAVRLLHELSTLVAEDMRKTAGQKIQEAIRLGRCAIAEVGVNAPFIAEELSIWVGALDKTPVDAWADSLLDDSLFKMKTMVLAARVEVMRQPAFAPALEAVRRFADSLAETAEFCRSLAGPDGASPAERKAEWHFSDIARRSSVLRFFIRGEAEKLGLHLQSGGLLDEEQKVALLAIDGMIDDGISAALEAADASAYASIAGRLDAIADTMSREVTRLSTYGGAVEMLAAEFGRLSGRARSCVVEQV